MSTKAELIEELNTTNSPARAAKIRALLQSGGPLDTGLTPIEELADAEAEAARRKLEADTDEVPPAAAGDDEEPPAAAAGDEVVD